MTYDDDTRKAQTTPLLSTRTEEASVAEICSIIGVEVRQKARRDERKETVATSFPSSLTRCLSSWGTG